MSIEIDLLRVFSIRSNLENYLYLINPKTLSKEGLLILQDYKAYFNFKKDQDKIDFSRFSTFFFIERHPSKEDDWIEKFKHVLELIENADINEKECTEIIESFQKAVFYEKLHEDLDNNTEIEKVSDKIEAFKDKMTHLKSLNSDLEEDMDLEASLVFTNREHGLKWRLNCLKEHFSGGLIKGDFGIIAGVSDSGKTSFIASEMSYMAQQLKDDEYIAWINTEGNWQQILPRIYCATLGCTSEDLRNNTQEAKERYIEKMNGDKNRIKILNFQGKSIKDVELLIKEKAPSLIVFDLLDSIRGFDSVIGKEGNVAERYGQLYQWAREVATKHCPVLAVSQLNGDAYNQPYPSMSTLRGSRVDKQSAATFQLIIGSEEGNGTERYLSTPKNKINSNKGWKAAVKFDSRRARFIG